MADALVRTGEQVLADLSLLRGVERQTCMPGGSDLSLLDARHDTGADVLVCRQEGGAAIMAEVAGKLTGLPGLRFVVP